MLAIPIIHCRAADSATMCCQFTAANDKRKSARNVSRNNVAIQRAGMKHVAHASYQPAQRASDRAPRPEARGPALSAALVFRRVAFQVLSSCPAHSSHDTLWKPWQRQRGAVHRAFLSCHRTPARPAFSPSGPHRLPRLVACLAAVASRPRAVPSPPPSLPHTRGPPLLFVGAGGAKLWLPVWFFWGGLLTGNWPFCVLLLMALAYARGRIDCGPFSWWLRRLVGQTVGWVVVKLSVLSLHKLHNLPLWLWNLHTLSCAVSMATPHIRLLVACVGGFAWTRIYVTGGKRVLNSDLILEMDKTIWTTLAQNFSWSRSGTSALTHLFIMAVHVLTGVCQTICKS